MITAETAKIISEGLNNVRSKLAVDQQRAVDDLLKGVTASTGIAAEPAEVLVGVISDVARIGTRIGSLGGTGSAALAASTPILTTITLTTTLASHPIIGCRAAIRTVDGISL